MSMMPDAGLAPVSAISASDEPGFPETS